jgi:hypothetical protein
MRPPYNWLLPLFGRQWPRRRLSPFHTSGIGLRDAMGFFVASVQMNAIFSEQEAAPK